MKRFIINADGSATYGVADGHVVDVAAAVKAVQNSPELTAKAVSFALGHIFRNATAGKMEKVEDAVAAVTERAKALAEGKWATHREGGETGESRASLLAQALAEVMGATPAEAAAFISDEIQKALEEKNIDPEAATEDLTPEQKTERRKIANSVRKSISDDPAVAAHMASLKATAAAAKAAEAVKAAEGKTSAFAK